VSDDEAADRACEHESSSGVDQVANEDPAKVWRCDGCGVLHVGDQPIPVLPDWGEGWADQRCVCGAQLVHVSGWGRRTRACSVTGWGIEHDPPCTGIPEPMLEESGTLPG